jgi:hypothetical protein
MTPLRSSYAATVAQRLTSLLFVATIVIALALTYDTTIGGGRDVSFDARAPLNHRLIPKGVDAIDAHTTISIRHPTAHQQRLALAADLLPLLLLALPVLWLLRGVAGSVRDGDPFGARNVRRLRVLGVLLIVGVPALHYATSALHGAVADPYLSSPFEPFSRQRLLPDNRFYFPATALLCGLGAFVLAQVFAHGVRLREDVDATI